MEKDGFSWWIRRIRRAQDLYDEFRIDHFRGFAGFWAVPSGEYFRLHFGACVCYTNVLHNCAEARVAMVGRWKVLFL
jgi:4-alpha-glucanotransferase